MYRAYPIQFYTLNRHAISIEEMPRIWTVKDHSRKWKQDLRTLTKDFSPLFLLSPQALEGVKRILGKRTWDMARLQLSWLLRMCNTTEMDIPQFLCFGSRRAMTAHLRQYNYTIPREVTLTDLKQMMMTWFRIQIRQKLITLPPPSTIRVGSDKRH